VRSHRRRRRLHHRRGGGTLSLRTRIFLTTLGLALAVIAAVWVFSARQISTTVIESVVAHDPDVTVQARRAQLASALARAYAAGDMQRVRALAERPPGGGLIVAVSEHGRVTMTNVPSLRGASMDDRGSELTIGSARTVTSERHRMMLKASPSTYQRVSSPSRGTSALIAVLPQDPKALEKTMRLAPDITASLQRAGVIAPQAVLPGSSAAVGRLRRDFLIAGIVALVGSVIAAFALSASVAIPLRRLTTAVSALEGGARDVRVAVKGKDELSRLGVAFNAMSRAVARAEEQRRELVADVAHELRTPLNNLRVELEAIRDGLAAASPVRINSLYDECGRLAVLVEDLQELSQSDAGALTLDRQPIAADDLVGAAVGAARVTVAAKGATVSTEIDPGLPLLCADGEKLRRVLVNLIRNAASHGRENGAVIVRAARDGAAIRFAVEDDGPGIPPDDLERIFERFYRVDKSRNRSTGGSGLGLAIARRLVEAHGGSIAAYNNSGGGATFAFTVPIAPEAAHAGRTTVP
jgi:two-component system sensor histidine kinase BaeS